MSTNSIFPKDWISNKEYYYKTLKFPDVLQWKVFEQYQIYLNHVYNLKDLKNILEIGSGHSTILLALLGAERKCKAYTLDVGFSRLTDSIEGTSFKNIVDENIIFLKGTSITEKQFS